MSEQKSSFMDAKTASWFAYVLSILSAIIILVTEKDDKTVRIHAWQSLILGCCLTAVMIVLSIITGILIASFAFGAIIIISILSWLVWLAWAALSIICILKAVQGDVFKLPVIYDKVQNFK